MARMTEEERTAAMERIVAEEVRRPLDYFAHDSNASDDPKLQRLRDECGWEAMGRFWRLVELLSAAEGHLVDVSRPQQWTRLAHALEYDGADAAREFVARLVEFGLVDRDALEGGHVMSVRVMRNAERVANDVAKCKLAARVRWS